MNIRNLTEEQREEKTKENLIKSLDSSYNLITNEILKIKNEESINNVKRNVDHISQIINSEEYSNLILDINKYQEIINIGRIYIES